MHVFGFIQQSLTTGLHLFGTGVYGFAIMYQMAHNDPNNPRSSYIGDIKYLTYWNLLFQFMFNSLSLVKDIFVSNTESHSFSVFLDSTFFCTTFPFSVFVCGTFWLLDFVDKGSVRDPDVNSRYPEWYTHITHSLNGPMNFIEMLMTYHEEPYHRHAILVLLTVFSLYFTLLIILGIFVDLWIYPFLAKLYWSQRIIFAVICGVILIIYYMTGVGLSKVLWPQCRVNWYKKVLK
ncbi:androgen-dependent TFPI-regulating protein-like [Oppia nitens]|uniref:androgen-dependent TFPI-regulating protein-like n=1 Tax=Oppia nitens TaxID=1686743 RepID=UPI0023DBB953|nr:androgen-dependent TFPI-regulating protein-like [Oppia nitens]